MRKLAPLLVAFLVGCGCTTTAEIESSKPTFHRYTAQVENLTTHKVKFVECDAVRVDAESFSILEGNIAGCKIVAEFDFNEYSYLLIANEEKK